MSSPATPSAIPSTCASCGTALAAAGSACPRCALERAATPPPRAPRSAASTPQQLAGRIPGYEVQALIGEGGMGAVYRARQTKLERVVALKLLSPELTRDPAVRERFAREAQALAKLAHPHIVGVHDYGEVELEPGTRLCYLAMELVDGANLRDVLREGKLAPAQALALVPPLCAALQYAHDRGVVHRDIKPENILLDEHGAPKIADFGLAKLADLDPGLTSTGALLGTPKYMAPEQIEHPARVDHRADIYALGVVLYEMLTGELPLGRFEVPSRKVHVDVHLDEVVLKALEKAPERRYQQASEMKQRVEEVGTSRGGAAADAQAGVGDPQHGHLRVTWTRGTGAAVIASLSLFASACLPWVLERGGVMTPSAGELTYYGSVDRLHAWECPPALSATALSLATCALAILRVASRRIPFGVLVGAYVLAAASLASVCVLCFASPALDLALGAWIAMGALVVLGAGVWHLRDDRNVGIGRSFALAGTFGARGADERA